MGGWLRLRKVGGREKSRLEEQKGENEGKEDGQTETKVDDGLKRGGGTKKLDSPISGQLFK